jgi:hypothetical protein
LKNLTNIHKKLDTINARLAALDTRVMMWVISRR